MLKQNKRTKFNYRLIAWLCFTANITAVNAQENVGAVNDPNLFTNPPASAKQTSEADAEKLQKELQNNPLYADTLKVQSLGLAIGVSETEFQKSEKTNLVDAPKDQAGNFYLDLDSPYKAVSLPTKFGTFPVNLDAMRLRHEFAQKSAELAKKAAALNSKSAIVAKSAGFPVNQVFISAVSSANYDNPYTAGIELDVPGSAFNHGGSWVGAVSQEVGDSYAFGMTVCGAYVPNTYAVGVAYYQNGQEVGYWRAMFTQSGCQNGWIQSGAVGANGVIYSPAVYFN